MAFNPLNLNKIGHKSIYDRYKYHTDDSLAVALSAGYFDLNSFNRKNKTRPIIEVLASNGDAIIEVNDITGVSINLGDSAEAISLASGHGIDTPSKVAESLAKAVTAQSGVDSLNSSVTALQAGSVFTPINGTVDATEGWLSASGTFVALDGFFVKRFTVVDSQIVYASGTTGGGAAFALASYYNASGTFIGREFAGGSISANVDQLLLTIPSGTTQLAMTLTAAGILETRVLVPFQHQDKKIAWFGTSIPETGYPQLVGAALGVTVYNQAEGSSMARAFNGKTGTFVGLNYINCLKSLGQTIAEKQSIMDNWTTGLAADGSAGGSNGWRDLLTGSPPDDYATWRTATQILSYSYENKIVAKHLNTNHADFVASPDCFVFDHGHNDVATLAYDNDDAQQINVPSTRDNRATFIGGMNYLIDIILSYNARAKIIFIGHYENERRANIALAQDTLFNYWDYPSIKLWEKMGWSQNTVTSTGYWSNSLTWVASGGSEATKTMTEIWMQDNLHPFSTPAKELIASKLKNFIDKSL